MKMLLDMVNQNIQEALKKFQDTKNKEYEKTETNKWTHRSPKHQSKTDNTINKQMIKD
jgi:hypothetical protein